MGGARAVLGRCAGLAVMRIVSWKIKQLAEPSRAVSAVKRMIKAAKAARRVTQEEIDRIRELAQAMDASARAEREIANVWGR